MKQITIVIPFLNEGDEPLRTTVNLNEAANPDLFDIVLVHDSGDPLPFTVPLEYKNVKVHINGKRCGVAGSRMNGVALAETPYIILTDAHMRFDKNDWLDVTIEALNSNPKTLFAGLTRGVKDEKVDHKSGGGFGCRLLMKNEQVSGVNASFDNILLSPKWIREVPGVRYEIPCVMGAYYAMSKDWFNYIGQERGLYMWGGDEACLSLKTWLMGGKVIQMKDVVIGHKYRDQVSPLPYTLYNWYKLYNNMYMIYTLFPDELVHKAIDHIKELPYPGDVDAAYKHAKANGESIIQDRIEFQSKLVHDIDWFCDKFKLAKFWA